MEVDAAALSKITVPNLVRLIERVHILPSLYSVPSLTIQSTSELIWLAVI